MLILALTADVFPENKAAGMNDLTPKLIDPEAPFAAIFRWLSQASDTRGTGP